MMIIFTMMVFLVSKFVMNTLIAKVTTTMHDMNSLVVNNTCIIGSTFSVIKYYYIVACYERIFP